MPTPGDRQTFRNEDLVLRITPNIDPAIWDESRYEAFLDELCGMREYQKEAIRTTLKSSIRDSLTGCGGRVAVLNDEGLQQLLIRIKDHTTPSTRDCAVPSTG